MFTVNGFLMTIGPFEKVALCDMCHPKFAFYSYIHCHNSLFLLNLFIKAKIAEIISIAEPIIGYAMIFRFVVP